MSSENKIWVNSADSHVWEPADLWESHLPARMKGRGPRMTRHERVDVYSVDDKDCMFTPAAMHDAITPPGMLDLNLRLADLDGQGVWAEVVFPSMGLWITVIDDAELMRACATIYNDWAMAEVNRRSPRLIAPALLPSVAIEDTVAVAEQALKAGFRSLLLPTTVPAHNEYNKREWDRLWALAEEAKAPVTFHIGTGTAEVIKTRGMGGGLINYWESSVPAQRAIVHLVSAGVLDRFPGLKVMTAEAGASWVSALGDRLDEAYRQHGLFAEPKLTRLPSEIIAQQVYTSFQHDQTAIPTMIHMGYRNIMWGSDYPHLEGTFPNTQQVLRELLHGVSGDVADRVTLGCFSELFGVGLPGDLRAANAAAAH